MKNSNNQIYDLVKSLKYSGLEVQTTDTGFRLHPKQLITNDLRQLAVSCKDDIKEVYKAGVKCECGCNVKLKPCLELQPDNDVILWLSGWCVRCKLDVYVCYRDYKRFNDYRRVTAR